MYISTDKAGTGGACARTELCGSLPNVVKLELQEQAESRVTRSRTAAAEGEARASEAEVGDIICAASKGGPFPFIVGVVSQAAHKTETETSSPETGAVGMGVLALVVTKLEPINSGSMEMEVSDRQLTVLASEVRMGKMEAEVSQTNREAVNLLEGPTATQSATQERFKERDRVTFSSETREEIWRNIAH